MAGRRHVSRALPGGGAFPDRETFVAEKPQREQRRVPSITGQAQENLHRVVEALDISRARGEAVKAVIDERLAHLFTELSQRQAHALTRVSTYANYYDSDGLRSLRDLFITHQLSLKRQSRQELVKIATVPVPDLQGKDEHAGLLATVLQRLRG